MRLPAHPYQFRYRLGLLLCDSFLNNLVARSTSVCLVCILIVIQSMHTGEHLAVRLER